MNTLSSSDQAQRVRAEAALASRLDHVEREYRRLRRFTISLLVGAGALLGLAVAMVAVSARYGMPGTVAEVVAARQFVLRGENGAIRGLWGTEDDGTLRLVLQDPTEHPRVKLNLLNDGASGLTFSDSVGRPRVVFAFLPDQSSSLVFADEGGKTRMVLGISAEGGATLVFADRSGATRAGLGVDRNGAGTFTLSDRSGRDVANPEPDPPAATPSPSPTPPPAEVTDSAARPNSPGSPRRQRQP